MNLKEKFKKYKTKINDFKKKCKKGKSKTFKLYSCNKTSGKIGDFLKGSFLTTLAFMTIGAAVYSVDNKNGMESIQNNLQQTIENCELLGVDSKDLNTKKIDDFFYDHEKKNRLDFQTQGIATYRLTPDDGSAIKIFYSKELGDMYYKNIERVVNELNYIAKNIGDPVRYELNDKPGTEGRRKCDMFVHFYDLDELKAGTFHFNNYFMNNFKLTGINPEIRISEKYFGNSVDANEFEETFTHEMCHYICDLYDSYQVKDNEADLEYIDTMSIKLPRTAVTSDPETGESVDLHYLIDLKSSEKRSIMDGNDLLTANDVLLWCAKNSLDVAENYQKYIDFAKSYEAEKLLATFDSSESLSESDLYKSDDTYYSSISLEALQAYREKNKVKQLEYVNNVEAISKMSDEEILDSYKTELKENKILKDYKNLISVEKSGYLYREFRKYGVEEDLVAEKLDNAFILQRDNSSEKMKSKGIVEQLINVDKNRKITTLTLYEKTGEGGLKTYYTETGFGDENKILYQDDETIVFTYTGTLEPDYTIIKKVNGRYVCFDSSSNFDHTPQICEQISDKDYIVKVFENTCFPSTYENCLNSENFVDINNSSMAIDAIKNQYSDSLITEEEMEKINQKIANELGVDVEDVKDCSFSNIYFTFENGSGKKAFYSLSDKVSYVKDSVYPLFDNLEEERRFFFGNLKDKKTGIKYYIYPDGSLDPIDLFSVGFFKEINGETYFCQVKNLYFTYQNGEEIGATRGGLNYDAMDISKINTLSYKKFTEELAKNKEEKTK